jgi:hypothetical protein
MSIVVKSYKLPSHKVAEFAGYFLLVFSLIIGTFTLYRGSFVDEGDNLATGWFLSQGMTLYKDIFSHHFPFTYLWVAFFVSFTGRSIFAVRFSLLLFQLISVFIAMRLSRFTLTLGLFSVVWSVIGIFYKGNFVLYNVFAGVALLVIFSIVLAVVTGKITPTRKHGIALGIFSFIAILSDPLSIYPVFITAIFLLFKARPLVRDFFLSFILLTSTLIGYFLLTGSLIDFVNQAVKFNATVYNKYLETNPIRLFDLVKIAFSGLGIAKPIWWDFAPMRVFAATYDHFNRWFYTGFIFRFSIIVAAINWLMRKKYLAAGYIYFFAASLLVMNDEDFRSSVFAMMAIFVMIYLVTNQFSWPKLSSPLFMFYKIGSLSIICLSLLLLVYRTGSDIWENRANMNYAFYFGAQEAMAEKLLEKSCNNPEVLLAYYPGNPYMYWFTNLKPVSKYVYFWPWVADIGQDEVITILENPDTKALASVADTVIWQTYATTDYLQPLFEFLEENYIKSGDIYISPNLEDCQTE